MMRLAPERGAVAVSELLPGQRFDVVHRDNGWAWGFSAHDHYVGYMEADALSTDAPARTHRISAPTALAFSRPDIKSEALYALPLNAEIAAEDFDEKFYRTTRGMFVHKRHAAPVGEYDADPVAVAEMFVGTPYRWGGRTRKGIDCSGLVQIALGACGFAAPRDTDLQAGALGRPVEDGSYARGDLVFFPGHVGIMVDGERLLHANAHFMTTLVEPLEDVVARLRPTCDEPVTAVKRL
jgi:cell wall-associated NlpC family hydrolase